jgi:hypothetical protein
VLEARHAVEAEIERLLSDRKQLRINRPKWLDVTLSKKLEKLRMVAKVPELDRQELHSMLKSLFVKVIIDWQHNRLRFHWKHGGESIVKVDMRSQRKAENKRRGNRPRYQPGELAPALPKVAR